MNNPDDEPRHQPLKLGVAFWTAMIFGLTCVISGYLFARFGPILLSHLR
jgi:hypothetical protein